MKDPVRKLLVSQKKVPKSILVVTNTTRMLPRMEGIRALGYECTLVEAGGGAMNFLRSGARVNVVVLDLKSAEGAGRLIRWVAENRPGVRVVCIVDANFAEFGCEVAALGARVLDESKIDQVPQVLLSLLGEQVR